MKAALLPLIIATTLALQAQGQGAPPASPSAPRSTAVSESIRELLELSLKNGKGLMFYLGSQSLGGAVTKIGEHTVEVRNREYSRIVIRLDRIDAVAMN
jgi:hypothetical protein